MLIAFCFYAFPFLQGAAVEQHHDEHGVPPVPQQPVQLGKRRNDEQSVMSARERYLARKKQLTG